MRVEVDSGAFPSGQEPLSGFGGAAALAERIQRVHGGFVDHFNALAGESEEICGGSSSQ